MKKFLIFLLSLAACSSPVPDKFQAMSFKSSLAEPVFSGKTVIIGTGSGSITKTDMTGLNPGDILQFKPGRYSGANLGPFNGIKITGMDSVSFHGTVTLNSLTNCYVEHFRMDSINGTGISWWGAGNRRNVERFITFNNVTGNCNDGSKTNYNDLPYTGDTSSLKFYMCTWDNIKIFKSGLLLLGSFGETKDKVNYADSTVFSNITIDSTLSNGTEVRGVFFRMEAYNWRVNFIGVNTASGDVGMFYIYGNFSVHNIYRNGGRGYVARLWNVSLGNYVANSFFYNNIDLNTATYGTIESRIEAAQIATYTPNGGNCFVYNNTSGNKQDNIGYWSPILMAGNFPKPYILQCYNNTGFNLYTGKSTHIYVDKSNGTWNFDTAHNYYQPWAKRLVDSITGKPVSGSPVIGKGLTVPWITEDIYHSFRAVPYDMGAVAYSGSVIPPVNPCPPVPPVYVHDTTIIHDTIKIPYAVHDTIAAKVIKTVTYFDNGTIQ